MAEVARMLNAAGCTMMPCGPAAKLLSDLPAFAPDEIAGEADLAIVIGGDGSLLAAARTLGWARVPLVGVNLGRIGFLADIRSGALTEELGAVLAGDYTRERRNMLRVEIGGPDAQVEHAINDVVIKRRDGARVLEIEAWVGEARFGRTRGDGIIVATPTGSTAYALSAGGPIIAAGFDAFAIVPICPHSLGERPAVVPSDRIIRLRPLIEGSEAVDATLDGQTVLTLMPGEELRVSRAEHELSLIHPPGYEYFATLREKLGWGGRAPGC